MVVPNSGDFQSLGCYSDSGNNRGLANMQTDWDGMTVEKCADIAKDYKYAGVEYYGECHYGNDLSSASVPSSGCDTPCAGNNAELCGGGDRMNLYENKGYKPPATENPGVGTFHSLGCYTDSASSRGLEFMTTDWNSMTVAACASAAQDYKYMGVEYYG